MLKRIKNVAGFTLIEIIAVVLLIGLLAGSASIMFNVGGSQSDMEKAGERFIQTANHMGEFAILSGNAIGLVVVPPAWSERQGENWAYYWQASVEMEDSEGNMTQQWADVEGSKKEVLADGIELLVELEGGPWEWSAGPKTSQPVFLLFPSGDAEPLMFSLQFQHDDFDVESQTFELDQNGRLVWAEATADFESLRESLR